MSRSRSNKASKETTSSWAGEERHAAGWELFFRDQRAPFVRSQLVTAIMAGRVLEVERLPVIALLDAVLLATAARVYLEAEIIDDYQTLLRRADDAWKDPMWTCRVFDQTHSAAANFVIQGSTEFKCYEEAYIPDFVARMLEQDPPVYFKKELA